MPYRCLYSRNVPNLFMAGRDISVTHEALGTVRVMATCGMMGEVVGMAAKLCIEHDATPRDVYEKYLDEFKGLLRTSLSKPRPRVVPEPVKAAGPNLAVKAKVAVSGSYKPDEYPVKHVNDGLMDLGRNDLRWLSEEKTPNWVELTWDEPQTLGMARVVSGYTHGGTTDAPITDFVFQVHDGGEWITTTMEEARELHEAAHEE